MAIGNIVRTAIQGLIDILRRIRVIYFRMVSVSIGKNCFISLGAKLDTCGGKIVIGDRCTITYGCIILVHDRVARLLNPNDKNIGMVRIGNGSFIGVNSVILRNVTIGDNAIIGACLLVSEDIPPDTLAMGIPSRIKRELSENL